MRRRLLRITLATSALLLIGSVGTARAAGCPSHLTNGQIVCHNTAGTSCEDCTYNCDGELYRWNVCNVE